TLLFHSDRGNLAITPISDDVVRVRFTTAQAFGRDHSYAVMPPSRPSSTARAEIGHDATILTTASLKVVVQHRPLRIGFKNAAGESLDADDAERGLAFV